MGLPVCVCVVTRNTRTHSFTHTHPYHRKWAMLQSSFSSPASRPCAPDQIPEAAARHRGERAAPLVIREMQLSLKRHSAINTLLFSPSSSSPFQHAHSQEHAVLTCQNSGCVDAGTCIRALETGGEMRFDLRVVAAEAGTTPRPLRW